MDNKKIRVSVMDDSLARKVPNHALSHLTGACTPEVNAAAQPNGQHILGGPVDQVEIEVVLQFGRVQHFERDFGDFARRLPGRTEQLLAFDADGRQRVRALFVVVLCTKRKREEKWFGLRKKG